MTIIINGTVLTPDQSSMVELCVSQYLDDIPDTRKSVINGDISSKEREADLRDLDVEARLCAEIMGMIKP